MMTFGRNHAALIDHYVPFDSIVPGSWGVWRYELTLELGSTYCTHQSSFATIYITSMAQESVLWPGHAHLRVFVLGQSHSISNVAIPHRPQRTAPPEIRLSVPKYYIVSIGNTNLNTRNHQRTQILLAKRRPTAIASLFTNLVRHSRRLQTPTHANINRRYFYLPTCCP